MNLDQSPALPAAPHTRSLKLLVACGVADTGFRAERPQGQPSATGPSGPPEGLLSRRPPWRLPGPPSGGAHAAGGPARLPPPPCTLVIAVGSGQKELDKPSRNFILILQMKMETCLLKSRQLCQQAGLRQQGKASSGFQPVDRPLHRPRGGGGHRGHR